MKDLTRAQPWAFVPLAFKKSVAAELSSPVSSVIAQIPRWEYYYNQEQDPAARAAVQAQPQEIILTDRLELNLDAVTSNHLVLTVPEQQQVQLVIHGSALDRLHNVRIDVVVGAESQLTVIQNAILSSSAPQLLHLYFYMQTQSQVEMLSVLLGGMQRLNLRAYMQGVGANFNLRHLGISRAQQQNHLFVAMEHESPECVSNQLIRTILEDNGLFSCDNTVHIPKDIINCEAHQLINSLLISGQAKCITKPTMLIYNEQVQASHGNTIGSLDPESMFYLLSRGMSETSARKTLMRAFAHEIFMGLKPDPVWQALEKQILEQI